jgi:hypothetical protein
MQRNTTQHATQHATQHIHTDEQTNEQYTQQRGNDYCHHALSNWLGYKFMKVHVRNITQITEEPSSTILVLTNNVKCVCGCHSEQHELP